LDSKPQKKGQLKSTKNVITNYRQYYTKITNMITYYSKETLMLEQEMLKCIIL